MCGVTRTGGRLLSTEQSRELALWRTLNQRVGAPVFVEENRRLIFYYEFGDQEFESLGRAV